MIFYRWCGYILISHTHFSTKHWEIWPKWEQHSCHASQSRGFGEFYQMTGGKGLTLLLAAPHPSPVCWLHWNANDARAFAEGKIVFPGHKGARAAPLPQQSFSWLPESPKQPQFSPFTPILLHLTGRTTGSDTDEFAKSKENNWIQQENQGWVLRGLLRALGEGDS